MVGSRSLVVHRKRGKGDVMEGAVELDEADKRVGKGMAQYWEAGGGRAVMGGGRGGGILARSLVVGERIERGVLLH